MVSCDPEVFDDLIDNYPAILHAVSECLWSTEPAVRCACLEGLRGFLSCQCAVEWYVKDVLGQVCGENISHDFLVKAYEQ